MLLDQPLDLSPVEISDRHHRHQVRPVPVPVEPAERVVLERAEHLHRPDREPVGVARALEQDRELLVPDPRVGAPAQTPLLDDDVPLPVDLAVVEADQMRPVLEDVEPFADDRRRVGGHLEHVDGFIEARVGVEIGPESDPDRFQIVDQLLPGEMPGAVERHVLHQVCQPPLVLVLEDRARVHDQPELRPLLGPVVHPDEI